MSFSAQGLRGGGVQDTRRNRSVQQGGPPPRWVREEWLGEPNESDGVQRALGQRVAGLVGLHVAAKRYLVASGGRSTYRGGLSAGSVTSLSLQGGPMSSDERTRFEALPLFGDAVALRRADDRGKVDGLVVDGLAAWMEVVRRVAAGVA